MKFFVVPAIAAVAFTGCVPPVTADQEKAASSVLTPENAELQIKAWMKSNLLDPDVKDYSFDELKVSWVNSNGCGHMAHIRFNAKNGFGGYMGLMPYVAQFTNGRLIQVIKTR